MNEIIFILDILQLIMILIYIKLSVRTKNSQAKIEYRY